MKPQTRQEAMQAHEPWFLFSGNLHICTHIIPPRRYNHTHQTLSKTCTLTAPNATKVSHFAHSRLQQRQESRISRLQTPNATRLSHFGGRGESPERLDTERVAVQASNSEPRQSESVTRPRKCREGRRSCVAIRAAPERERHWAAKTQGRTVDVRIRAAPQQERRNGGPVPPPRAPQEPRTESFSPQPEPNSARTVWGITQSNIWLFLWQNIVCM